MVTVVRKEYSDLSSNPGCLWPDIESPNSYPLDPKHHCLLNELDVCLRVESVAMWQ